MKRLPKKLASTILSGIAVLCLQALLVGCAGIPDGVEALRGFDVKRYLGTWYEIARLDHSFERGLTKVRAEYTLRDDGGINVTNTGFDPRKNVWKKVTGKAYFVEGPQVGRLKVSFFAFFYGGYNIIELDKDYSYALVCGPSRKYLWILAREPRMEEPVKAALIEKARNLGFDTDKLIFVEHQVPTAMKGRAHGDQFGRLHLPFTDGSHGKICRALVHSSSQQGPKTVPGKEGIGVVPLNLPHP